MMISNKGRRDNYRNTMRDGGEGIQSVHVSLTDILKDVNFQLCHQNRAGVLLPLGQERGGCLQSQARWASHPRYFALTSGSLWLSPKSDVGKGLMYESWLELGSSP